MVNIIQKIYVVNHEICGEWDTDRESVGFLTLEDAYEYAKNLIMETDDDWFDDEDIEQYPEDFCRSCDYDRGWLEWYEDGNYYERHETVYIEELEVR